MLWQALVRLVIAAGVALAGLSEPAFAADPIPLRCRLGDGPWQACSMVVESPGERWEIRVGGTRIAFRHDGSGTVSMHNPAGSALISQPRGRGWVPVQTTWISGPALCWNGVCAQGDIPLD
jgi:hypothetical protein